MSLFSYGGISTTSADQIYHYASELSGTIASQNLESPLKNLEKVGESENNAKRIINKVALSLNAKTTLSQNLIRDLHSVHCCLRTIAHYVSRRSSFLEQSIVTSVPTLEPAKYIPIIHRLSEHNANLLNLAEQMKHLADVIKDHSERSSIQETSIQEVLSSLVSRDKGDEKKPLLTKKNKDKV